MFYLTIQLLSFHCLKSAFEERFLPQLHVSLFMSDLRTADCIILSVTSFFLIATVNKHAKSCERDDGSMDGGASPVGGKIDYDRLGFLLNDSSMFKVYHFLTAHPRVKTPATWRPFMISRFPLWSLRV